MIVSARLGSDHLLTELPQHEGSMYRLGSKSERNCISMTYDQLQSSQSRLIITNQTNHLKALKAENIR